MKDASERLSSGSPAKSSPSHVKPSLRDGSSKYQPVVHSGGNDVPTSNDSTTSSSVKPCTTNSGSKSKIAPYKPSLSQGNRKDVHLCLLYLRDDITLNF